MRFKMSDFKVLDRVSIGLGGRYHGSFSLRHWLQQSDWLPTLEADLALDEESVRRVGDDTVGGPVVSRQLQITRILMRDLLIGVGILGNAAGFYEDGPNSSTLDNYMDRRQMMIAFDMRRVQGNDPSCLCEFLLQILHRNSPSGNVGLQGSNTRWELGCWLEPFILVIGNQTFQKNKFFGCPRASISAWTKMAGGAIHGYHEMGSWLDCSSNYRGINL